MKKIIIYILMSISVVSLSACSTIEKFVVSGNPGTEIYTPEQEMLSVVGDDGKAVIKLSSDLCYTYLLSKDINSQQYIPFALDYKNTSYAGTKTLAAASGVIFTAGALSELIGCIAVLGGDEDVATPFLLGGAVMLPTGIISGVTDARLSQITRQWQFSYLRNQQTNSDINFTMPVYSEPVKDRQTYAERGNSNYSSEANSLELPFKDGTYDVLEVVTYFNGGDLSLEPEGNVTIDGDIIKITIAGNTYLNEKSFKISRDLKKTRVFGEQEREYNLYEVSEGGQIGLYYDNSFEMFGVVEQRILLTANDSVIFEIAFM